MYSLNASLVQMTLRRMVMSSGTAYSHVIAHHRLSGEDVMMLQTLSSRKLQALDKLPISLFRVSYENMNVGNSGIDDDVFETSCISLTMILEAINFTTQNNLNPMIGIGFDQQAFNHFRGEPFLRRLHLVRKGGFALTTRFNLKGLELDADDHQAQLRDVVRILMGDYRYLSQSHPKRVGQILDWNVDMVGSEFIAEQLLLAGITPKLVAAHVGADDLVNRLNRKFRRENKSDCKPGGRVGSFSKAISRHKYDAVLFILIYLLLGNKPDTRINGFAACKAIQEYREICGHIGIDESDMLDPSYCWLLASAFRSLEMKLERCNSPSCRGYFVRDVRKRSRCIWCKTSGL